MIQAKMVPHASSRYAGYGAVKEDHLNDENKSVRDLFEQFFFSFFNHVRVFVSSRPLERSRPS